MKYLLGLSIILFSVIASAQIGTGQWRMHVPPSKGLSVVANSTTVFCGLQNGLLSYDLESSEVTVRDRVSDLSDINVSAIGLDNSKNKLYIGYDNGNIDVLENEAITNLPVIPFSQISGDKKVYAIKAYEDLVYFSTGFGIVVMDPSKNEVKDTYYPNNAASPILEVAFLNDSLFALTENKLYAAQSSNNFLADPGQWNEVTYLPNYTSNGAYKSIAAFNDELIIAYDDDDFGVDSVFRFAGSQKTSMLVYDFAQEVNTVSVSGDKLLINTDGGIQSSDLNWNLTTPIFSYTFSGYPAVQQAIYHNDKYYVADKFEGLVEASNSFSNSKISFSGPAEASSYRLSWTNGKLTVSGGGLTNTQNTFNDKGIYMLEDETWQNLNKITQPIWNGLDVFDFMNAAIDPQDANHIAIGTNSEIGISIMNDGLNVTDTFTQVNSTLEETTLGNGLIYVTDLQYDEESVLWVLNGYSNNPLKALDTDGVWHEFNMTSAAVNRPSDDLEIDYNNVKWMTFRGKGIAAFDDNGTLDVTSDDKIQMFTTGATDGNLPSDRVQAIAVDFDNEIWIGTDVGLRILYNTDNIFDASPGEYNFQRLLLEFEEEVEEVLSNTSITDIEVDGANRKWIATSSAGVFLFSADGLTVIENFTAENSPLLSNAIEDIEIDQNTGEVFFATESGLVSYRGDATYGDANYENVTVFPNPVRPEFFGPITIQGIAFDSDVKITDVAGNLVYKTTSNGGTATWDGKTLQGERVKTGVYLIWTAVNTGRGRKVGKVVFIN